MKKATIGATGIELTELSFGTSSLGNISDADGYGVPEERAQQTLDRFFQGPVNLLDTSRNYGQGHSEARIGRAVQRRPLGGLLITESGRSFALDCVTVTVP